MSLINCPECGKEVSDKAESCPNCGYPISKNNQQYNGDSYNDMDLGYYQDESYLPRYRAPKTIFKIIVLAIAIILIVSLAKFQEKKDNTTKSDYSSSIYVNNEVSSTQVENPDDDQGDDFDFEISGENIILKSYTGNNHTIAIYPQYDVDGEIYTTDLSDFQVGSNDVDTIIFVNGITEVKTSIFNSCNVKKVYFPKTMECVYDYTLSYLHPDDGECIQIYYEGTEDEFLEIFKKYKRTKVEDSEFGEEMGTAIADKINEMIGSEYNPEDFEFYFGIPMTELGF